MPTRPIKVWDGTAWIDVGVTAPSTTGFVLTTNNLADVASPSTALSNLGGAPLVSPSFTTPALGVASATSLATDTITGSSAMATAALGAELGDGVSLTQNLTGLTIGAIYQVAAVSGTLTTATLNGNALTLVNNATSFKATATSHTVVGTAGTATAISVKKITARATTMAVSASGALVSQLGTSTYAGVLPVNLTTGSNNNALAQNAQYSLTTGSFNNALGVAAQYSLTTGSYNNALGHNAQYSLTTGSNNNALGRNAQYNLTTGSSNSALGHNAQYNLTSGSNNSAFGGNAQDGVTTGTSNSAFGITAQYALTSGSNNSALGANAGRAFTTGNYNLALGSGAGYSGTTATLSGTVTIGTNSSGTAAQATADNQITLGVAEHSVVIAGWLQLNRSQTTVGAAGAASALPASPTKYLIVKDSAGTEYVVPAFAKA